jgi:aminoglycoside 6-adenylyltransferase
MQTNHSERDVILQLVQWAEARDTVRAMLLTSTRAQPHAHVDVFSDYDVVLVVRDIVPFADDRSWLQDFGEVLVVYWDPIHPAPEHGIEQVSNVTQYADGLKIDFTLWPVELFQRIVAAPALPDDIDDGYAILLDKDGLTRAMRAPTYTAFIPARPSNDAFQTMIQEFFSDAPYVAKCLWRDELLPAKWCLDYDMKHVYLRPMLEWFMECAHGWSAPTGALGKGLKKRLPAAIWSELEQTYAGASMADNWEALYRTMALFRRVGIDVANHLGYRYPLELDQNVTAYVQQMQRQARDPQPLHDSDEQHA